MIRTNSMSNFSPDTILANRKMVQSNGGSGKTYDDTDRRPWEQEELPLKAKTQYEPGREYQSSYCTISMMHPLDYPFDGKLELKKQSSILGIQFCQEPNQSELHEIDPLDFSEAMLMDHQYDDFILNNKDYRIIDKDTILDSDDQQTYEPEVQQIYPKNVHKPVAQSQEEHKSEVVSEKVIQPIFSISKMPPQRMKSAPVELPADKQKTLNKPKLRICEFIKGFLLRDLRSSIKDSFNQVYGTSRFYRCKASQLRDLRAFWTGKIWKNYKGDLAPHQAQFYVPREYYDQHESVFFKLIYNTKNLADFDLPETPVTKLLDDLYGNNFSLKKFEQFLQDDTIKKIWWEGFDPDQKSWTFCNSQALFLTTKHLPKDKKQAFIKALGRLSIQEFSIFI